MHAPLLATSPRHGRRVVVFLDGASPSLTGFVRRLRRQGHVVLTLLSDEELRSHFEGAPVDLAILPFPGPSRATLRLLPWLASRHASTPIVLLAGAPTTRQVSFALDMGVVGILSEHSDLPTFVRVLDRAWQERDLRVLGCDASTQASQRATAARDRSERFDAALAELEVAYQPLVDGRSDERLAWEALVRAPTLCRNGAGPLLELARGLGRAGEVDAIVQHRVAEMLERQPRWTELFVNLEPESLVGDALYDPEGPLWAQAARVVLDLPDIDLGAERTLLRARIARLRTAGFRIAANDFGLWGHNPTQALDLAPEFVKVPMVDLRPCGEDPNLYRYVSFLLESARRTGSRIVAVGVADEQDRQLALDVGVDLLQGRLIAPPKVPARTASPSAAIHAGGNRP